jgi:hypothetical protein
MVKLIDATGSLADDAAVMTMCPQMQGEPEETKPASAKQRAEISAALDALQVEARASESLNISGSTFAEDGIASNSSGYAPL